MPELRPYQQADLDAVRGALRDVRSVLLCEPTGAGKGFLVAHILDCVKTKGTRCIFIVNRRELVLDMSENRLDALGIDHGIIMGDHKRRKPHCATQLCSIDTLHRRDTLPEADLIILDEARFCMSAKFKSVLARYPHSTKILGLDATPIRRDGQGLGDLFDALIVGPQVRELIADGYLMPSRLIESKKPPRLTKAQLQSEKHLAQVMSEPDRVKGSVQSWERFARDRKTVVFGVHTRDAAKQAEAFRCAGHDFAYVDADTSDTERKRIWHDYDYGRLNGICSVGVIAYGWNHAITSCVILNRPTASLDIHLQQLGRGSRPHPGKTDFLILDHAGNTARLNAMYEDDRDWALHGSAVKPSPDKVPSIHRCENCLRSFRAGPKECPFCHHPIRRELRDIKECDGDMQESQRKAQLLERQRALEATADEQKRQFFALCQEASRKNYRAGWAGMMYHLRFGRWPKRAWTIEAQGLGWLRKRQLPSFDMLDGVA